MDIKEAKKNLNRIVQKCKSIVKECPAIEYNQIYKIDEAIPVESIEEVLKELKRKNKTIEKMAIEIRNLHCSLVNEYGGWDTGYSITISTPKGRKKWTGQETTVEKVKEYFENYYKRKKENKNNGESK